MCAPSAPPPPDYAAASTAGVVADASTLPYRNFIEAARKLGKKITVVNPKTGEAEEVDFTGLGDADISGEYSDKMAAKALEIQKKYGSEFLTSARQQLAEADPEGWAARQKLFSEVMGAFDKKPDRQLAQDLQDQLLQEIKLGGTLDPETKGKVEDYAWKEIERETGQSALGNQVGRGGGYGKADIFSRGQEIGGAAEARRGARQQKALAFLTSGVSPEDVEYRRGQQNLSNVGAALAGQTPTAQFGQLSGAQGGAAPFWQQSGINTNPNAGQQGAQYAMQGYQTQMDFQSKQANPWMAGIGLGMKAVGMGLTAGNVGGFGRS